MGCASSTVVEAKPSSTVAEANHAHPDFFDNYVLDAKIGKGSFAQVRVAKKNDNTKELLQTCAVKILDLEPWKDDDTCKKLQHRAHKEVDVWNCVGSHDHCVRLHETFFDDHACYMVMEKCESNLLGYLKRRPEINERTVGGLLIQMLKGIEHVHSVKVVHMDVKPANFLIGGDHGNVVKLSDFGAARMLPSEKTLIGDRGSPPFMAPEMLQKLPYAHEIDIWSFGVTAYMLLFGALPYEPKEYTANAMKAAILDGLRPKFKVSHRSGTLRELTCSDSATAFVKAVLCRDPKTRPTASEALQLPFMMAVMQNNHMTGVELPFLHATVQLAKTLRAFEIAQVQKQSPLDTYLNARHCAKHDGILPEFAPVFLHDGMTKVLSPAGLVHSKLQKNSGVPGRLPSNFGRFQSNLGEEASDSTSCGTSKIDSEPSSKSSSKT